MPRRQPLAAAVRTQPWRLDAAFGPLEALLDKMARDGGLDLSDDRAALYARWWGNDIEELSLVIQGTAETFDIARKRDSACPSTEPLHRLAGKLTANEPLDIKDIADCRHCVAQLRTYTAGRSQGEMIDLVQTALIKFSMDWLDTQHAR